MVNAQNSEGNLNNPVSYLSLSTGRYANAELFVDSQHLTIDYTRTYSSGVGYRAGITHVGGLFSSQAIYSLPLKFVYRIPFNKRKAEQSTESDVYPYYDADPYNQQSYSFEPNYSSLPIFNLELDAGLSPGFIDGNTEESWLSPDDIIAKHNFLATTDVGFRASLRIWRLNLQLDVHCHYLLTDNFQYYRATSTKTVPRMYVSTGFGISFIL